MVKVYSGRHSPFGFRDFEFFRSNSRTLALIAEDHFPATMREGTEPERVLTGVVAGDYWRVLELRPQHGRLFALERDDVAAATPVAVLSDAFWRKRFTADPSVVGRTVRLGGATVQVIGVGPPGFGSSVHGFLVDLWVPIAGAAQVLGVPPERLGGGLYATGRLRDGTRQEQADAELGVLMERLRQQEPESYRNMTVRVMPARGLHAELRGPVALATAFLLVVTGLVILIACANVGNLLLARNAARRREVGIRVALGARRGRIVAQLLTESALLSVGAVVAGLVIAAWAGKLLIGLIPEGAPAGLTIPVAGPVLVYGLAVAAVAVLAFGLAPALRAAAPDVFSALRDDSRSVAGAKSRLRRGFLLAQIALSTVLLAVALLFVRSLGNARTIDTGIDASNLVAVSVDLSLGRYDEATGTRMLERLQREVGALPFVRDVSMAATVPLSGSRVELVYARQGDAPPAENAPRPLADVNIVGPSYFATVGIPLRAGRDFAATDPAGAAGVAVVNETMAARLESTGPALGRRVSVTGTDGPWLEVIGVARDIKYNSLGEGPTPVLYVPHRQLYRDEMLLHVRLAPGTPLASARTTLLDVVAAADPALPPAGFQPVSEAQDLALLPARIGAGVLGGFGAMALLLASVGIFGVAAFAVAQRTRELGIRSALGARPRALIGTVLGETARTVTAGALVGIALAVGSSQLLRSQLYGVGALDPLTFILVPLVLGLVAVLAAAIPAWRAVRVDPVTALRSE
jgi:predicted permease